MSELIKINMIGWNIAELNKLLQTSNSTNFADAIKSAITECNDINVLKAAAIKFDEVREFFSIEARLIDLIGEDEYFSFAEKHDLA